MRTTHRKAGFTLVELLVVIAVIALLVGMLLPVLSSARETAKRVICASDERQLFLSVMLYANDFDQWTPIRCNTGGGVCSDQISDFPENIPWPDGPSYESFVGGFLNHYGAIHRLWYCPCFQGKLNNHAANWNYWYSWMESESPAVLINIGCYTYQPVIMIGGVLGGAAGSSIADQPTIRVGQGFSYWDGYTYKFERCFLFEDTMGGVAGWPGWSDIPYPAGPYPGGLFMSCHFDGKNQGGNGARGDGSIEWQPAERWQYVLDGRWDVAATWQRN